MYCQSFSYDQQQQPESSQQQQDSFQYYSLHNHPVTQTNRTLTPVEQAPNIYFGDDLLQPIAELSADQFLLPSFTTVYQSAPGDNQQHLYTDFLVDTPQPQYANLVASTSTVKQLQSQQDECAGLGSSVAKQLFSSSDLTSPVAGMISDFRYDTFQPYPAATVVQEPEPSNQSYYRRDAGVDTQDLVMRSRNKSKSKPFLDGVNLRLNLASPSNLRPFKCSLCSMRFSRAWNLRQHLASHAGVKMFYCPLCGKSLARRQNVAYHLKNRHNLPEPAHWALADDGQAVVKETMRRFDDGMYHCSICNQSFPSGTRFNLLAAHGRRHSANFCCLASSSCRKRFRSAEGLIEHSNRRHFYSSESGLDCSQCSTTFTAWPDFLGHLVSHAEVNMRKKQVTNSAHVSRQYKCLKCWRKFTTRLALNRHNMSESHSYKCEYSGCNRNFAEKRRLKLHVKLAHPNNPTEFSVSTENQCSECKRCFTTVGGLNRHLSRTHSKASSNPSVSHQKKDKTRIPCPFRETALCGSMFDRCSQVDKHVKMYHRKRGHRKKKQTSEV